MQIWFHTQVPEFNKKNWFSNKINSIFTPSNPISRNSARFDKIHPDFTKFSSEVQKFSRGGKWCKIGFSRGAKWRKVAQSGAKWRKVAQSGAKLVQPWLNFRNSGWISESGAKWRKVAQSGAKLVQPWRKMMQNWFGHGANCWKFDAQSWCLHAYIMFWEQTWSVSCIVFTWCLGSFLELECLLDSY